MTKVLISNHLARSNFVDNGIYFVAEKERPIFPALARSGS